MVTFYGLDPKLGSRRHRISCRGKVINRIKNLKGFYNVRDGVFVDDTERRPNPRIFSWHSLTSVTSLFFNRSLCPSHNLFSRLPTWWLGQGHVPLTSSFLLQYRLSVCRSQRVLRPFSGYRWRRTCDEGPRTLGKGKPCPSGSSVLDSQNSTTEDDDKSFPTLLHRRRRRGWLPPRTWTVGLYSHLSEDDPSQESHVSFLPVHPNQTRPWSSRGRQCSSVNEVCDSYFRKVHEGPMNGCWDLRT